MRQAAFEHKPELSTGGLRSALRVVSVSRSSASPKKSEVDASSHAGSAISSRMTVMTTLMMPIP